MRTMRVCFKGETITWVEHYKLQRKVDSRIAILFWDNSFGWQVEGLLKDTLKDNNLTLDRSVPFPTGNFPLFCFLTDKGTTDLYSYITALMRGDPDFVAIVAGAGDFAIARYLINNYVIF